MYNDNIFVLLGHNGAGKTTTISMLTGLFGASEGSAELFDIDMFSEMESVR
jgi:ATP-binding cassette subfamily A (ABC1) protein 3